MKRFLILIFLLSLVGYFLYFLFDSGPKIPEIRPFHQPVASTIITSKIVRKENKKVTKITEGKKEAKIDINNLRPCDLIKHIKYNKINTLSYVEDKSFAFYQNMPKKGYELKDEKEYNSIEYQLFILADTNPIAIIDVYENFEKYFPTPSEFKERLKRKLNDTYQYKIQDFPFDAAILKLEQEIIKDDEYLFKLNDFPRWFPPSLIDYRSIYTESIMQAIKNSKNTTQMILSIDFIKKMKKPDYNFFLNLANHTRPDISKKFNPIINQLAKDIFEIQSKITFLPLLDYQGLELIIEATRNPKMKEKRAEFFSDLFTSYPLDSKACDDRNYINMCNEFCSR